MTFTFLFKPGTGQLFEGHFTKGDTVLLIDDVLMTGATILKDTPVRITLL